MYHAKKFAEHHQYHAEQDEERWIWTGLKGIVGFVLFFALLWLMMAFAAIVEPTHLWR